ncbi:MAG TPA: GxxExxY protein [Planctomycetes bacterium]|nr:GxxExxY protein [Planctomycetota bacterium]
MHDPATLSALTQRIIGCCIEVHRELGPGLLESVYEDALSIVLEEAGLDFVRQGEVPVSFRGRRLPHTLRYDLLVSKAVLVELKAVESLAGIHQAQVVTYLRLTGAPIGLLCNFNVEVMHRGIKRLVNPMAGLDLRSLRSSV